MRRETIQNRITKPTSCLFAIGIPITIPSFCKDIDTKIRKDFSRSNILGGLRQFERKIARYSKPALNTMRRSGVKVIEECSFVQFCREVQKGNYDAIILFSHWMESTEEVEFFDGMYEYSKVADCFTESFSGIIDLTICRPIKLGKLLRLKLDDSIIKFLDDIVLPRYALVFYDTLFRLLASGDYNFLTAGVEAKRLLQNNC